MGPSKTLESVTAPSTSRLLQRMRTDGGTRLSEAFPRSMAAATVIFPLLRTPALVSRTAASQS